MLPRSPVSFHYLVDQSCVDVHRCTKEADDGPKMRLCGRDGWTAMTITSSQTRSLDITPKMFESLTYNFASGTGPICEPAEQPPKGADHRGWEASGFGLRDDLALSSPGKATQINQIFTAAPDAASLISESTILCLEPRKSTHTNQGRLFDEEKARP